MKKIIIIAVTACIWIGASRASDDLTDFNFPVNFFPNRVAGCDECELLSGQVDIVDPNLGGDDVIALYTAPTTFKKMRPPIACVSIQMIAMQHKKLTPSEIEKKYYDQCYTYFAKKYGKICHRVETTHAVGDHGSVSCTFQLQEEDLPVSRCPECIIQ